MNNYSYNNYNFSRYSRILHNKFSALILENSGGSNFEGDIKFTRDQKQSMNQARASVQSNLWPNGRPVYTIESSLGKFYCRI